MSFIHDQLASHSYVAIVAEKFKIIRNAYVAIV